MKIKEKTNTYFVSVIILNVHLLDTVYEAYKKHFEELWKKSNK